MLELFISAFITLFVIMDPPGMAAIFVAMTSYEDKKRVSQIARKAVIVSTFILLFFGLLGETLMSKLGISASSFRIAGGVLLFVTSFRMLFGHNEPEKVESDRTTYSERDDIAVFPLAIPLLAGPGCITATILLFSRAQDFWDISALVLAILVVNISALVCLLAASPILRVIGKSGANVLARIMAIILAAMSVQFVLDGILPLLK